MLLLGSVGSCVGDSEGISVVGVSVGLYVGFLEGEAVGDLDGE